MNLKDVNTVLEHRICGGSEFLWSCYPNARHLDYEGDFEVRITDPVTNKLYSTISIKTDYIS